MLSVRSDRCEFFSARACGSDRTPLEVLSCCGLTMDSVEIPLRGRYGHGKVANVDEHFAEAVRAHKWYLANRCAYAKIGGVRSTCTATFALSPTSPSRVESTTSIGI